MLFRERLTDHYVVPKTSHGRKTLLTLSIVFAELRMSIDELQIPPILCVIIVDYATRVSDETIIFDSFEENVPDNKKHPSQIKKLKLLNKNFHFDFK